MNYIQYGQDFFHGNSSRWGTNGLFMSGQVEQSIALFGNELAADSLTFVVNSKALVGDGTGYAFLLDADQKPLKTSDGKWLIAKQVYTDWRNFVPGAALDLYSTPGGTMIGRFYVQDVTQISRKAVRFTCTDCIGILDGMNDHNGGIYTGETVAEICAEIFAGSGLSYSVGQDVGAVQCYGRLPRANRRANLGKLLVATGATLSESNGTVLITYLGAGAQTTMYQRNIYLRGGSVVNKDRSTGVEVTEHAFYQLNTDADAVLFDNTTEVAPVTSQLVVFQEPCHDLTATGTLTIEESNANFAVVSGVGTLSGKVYTHTQRQISKSTGVASNKVKVEKIEDNELIGYHNSDYVAQRMANWYKVAVGVDMEALDPSGALMPGTYVNITDPFGDARTGWTRKKSFAIANKTRAAWDVAIDWQPGPWGSNVDAWELITESKTWTVPAGVTSVTFYLGSGGDGGDGGSKGGNGQSGSYGESVEPGAGGAPGNGGSPGKVETITLAVTPGDTIAITIGPGGAGGAKNGGSGSAGTATTITHNGTTYTSATGTVPENGFLNQFLGETYALKGPDGVKGGNGGAYNGSGKNAENVVDEQTWTGGNPGATSVADGYQGNKAYGVGGGASGAAYGVNGVNGEDGNTTMSAGYNSSNAYGGDGADGPAAQEKPHSPTLASGGIGGNGGPGGGAGGPAEGAWRGSGAGSSWGNNYPGSGGLGGDGSKGGNGAPGFALALYKAAA